MQEGQSVSHMHTFQANFNNIKKANLNSNLPKLQKILSKDTSFHNNSPRSPTEPPEIYSIKDLEIISDIITFASHTSPNASPENTPFSFLSLFRAYDIVLRTRKIDPSTDKIYYKFLLKLCCEPGENWEEKFENVVRNLGLFAQVVKSYDQIIEPIGPPISNNFKSSENINKIPELSIKHPFLTRERCFQDLPINKKEKNLKSDTISQPQSRHPVKNTASVGPAKNEFLSIEKPAATYIHLSPPLPPPLGHSIEDGGTISKKNINKLLTDEDRASTIVTKQKPLNVAIASQDTKQKDAPLTPSFGKNPNFEERDVSITVNEAQITTISIQQQPKETISAQIIQTEAPESKPLANLDKLPSIPDQLENLRDCFQAWRRYTSILRKRRTHIIKQWQTASEHHKNRLMTKCTRQWRIVYTSQKEKIKIADNHYNRKLLKEVFDFWQVLLNARKSVVHYQKGKVDKYFRLWISRLSMVNETQQMVEERVDVDESTPDLLGAGLTNQENKKIMLQKSFKIWRTNFIYSLLKQSNEFELMERFFATQLALARKYSMLDANNEGNLTQAAFERWKDKYNNYVSLGEMAEDDYNVNLVKVSFLHWKRVLRRKKNTEIRADWKFREKYFVEWYSRTYQKWKGRHPRKLVAIKILQEWHRWAKERHKERMALETATIAKSDAIIQRKCFMYWIQRYQTLEIMESQGIARWESNTLSKSFAQLNLIWSKIQVNKQQASVFADYWILKRTFRRMREYHEHIQGLELQCNAQIKKTQCARARCVLRVWLVSLLRYQTRQEKVDIAYKRNMRQKYFNQWQCKMRSIRHRQVIIVAQSDKRNQAKYFQKWKKAYRKQIELIQKADAANDLRTKRSFFRFWKLRYAHSKKMGILAIDKYNTHIFHIAFNLWNKWKSKTISYEKLLQLAQEYYNRRLLTPSFSRWCQIWQVYEHDRATALSHYERRLFMGTWANMSARYHRILDDRWKMEANARLVRNVDFRRQRDAFIAWRIFVKRRKDLRLEFESIVQMLPERLTREYGISAVYLTLLLRISMMKWKEKKQKAQRSILL
ncbi:10934_t:CDS:10 [Ambispora gerdemannii]|uniref:10934_t:CDS:1 n=1 Tax=Ambispora gerdemannii TaxID=144530 RepID=A0A9N9FMA4_9GLOM|nr:10934_t:CDS:10 [Ambispora gerdemannii]